MKNKLLGENKGRFLRFYEKLNESEPTRRIDKTRYPTHWETHFKVKSDKTMYLLLMIMIQSFGVIQPEL